MRFGFATTLLTLCGLSLAPSVTAQQVDLSLAATVNTRPVIQTGKRPNLLQVKEGFDLSIMSENLGDISALIQSRLGQYYSADFKTGRIWQLKDQNKNGRVDSKRIMPHRFDGPSGLAVKGNKLYVADKNAIWLMEGVQPPKKLAGLRNANSLGFPHPLAITEDGSQLFLGLKNTEGEARLLSIDTVTGAASLLDTLTTEDTLIALSVIKGRKRPWVALTHSFGPSLSSLTPINTAHQLSGMALPQASSFKRASDKASSKFNNHIYLSRKSADGYDVLSVKANLGAPETTAESVLSGFLTRSGRSSWGIPATLLFDNHGLLIADRHNGDVYRLKAKPAAKNKAPKISDTPSSETPSSQAETTSSDDLLNTTEKWEVSTIKGSQIGTISNIGSASSLTAGSSILKNYKSLAEEYSEKEEEKEDASDEASDKTSETDPSSKRQRSVRKNR